MSDCSAKNATNAGLALAVLAAVLLAAVVAEAAQGVPTVFEPNHGQASPDARFVARTAAYTLFFTDSGAVVADRTTGDRVRIRMAGARPDVAIVGQERLPGRTHYLLGGDPARWRTDVPHYARVVYREPYPGIDAMYRTEAGRIAQDFIVQPGGDPARIRLRFDGVRRLGVNADGDLVLTTGGAPLQLSRPIAYQDGPEGRRRIPAAWTVQGGSAGFAVGPWDRSRPLVIDPVIAWATHLGGGGDDAIFGVAVDATGQVHVTGDTDSLDFPVTGGAALAGGTDAFAAKLDASGQVLLYAVFLGGGNDDGGRAIALDAANNAYIAGFTASPDFPVTAGSPQTVLAGGMDAFVVKLGPTGNIVHATYLGGSEADTALGVAVDSAGRAHVAGGTRSANFPVVNAFLLQPLPGGGTCGTAPDTFPCRDAFVARLNTLGTNLEYSTFLGGSNDDAANAIALDASGSVYVTGFTLSADFPTTPGVLQPGPQGGTDAFVARIDAAVTLGWAAYLGGAGADIGNGIAVDAAGRPHVVGSTASADFPATGGGFAGTTSGFATRLNAAGSALLWSRPLTRPEAVPTAVALDGGGDVVLVANDVVCTEFGPGIPPPCIELHLDVVVERLAAETGATVFVETFGGRGDGAAGEDFGQAIAARDQRVWVVGYTATSDFPTTGGTVQPDPGGGLDGFVVQLVDTTDIDVGGSSDCFIATAAFGTPLAAEVRMLRRFRDEALLTNAAGRLLTRVYYRLSPALARQVAARPTLAAGVRGILRPLARVTAVGLDRPVVLTGVGVIGLAVGLALTLAPRRRFRRTALVAGTVVAALVAGVLALRPPQRPAPSAGSVPSTIAAEHAHERAVAPERADPPARRQHASAVRDVASPVPAGPQVRMGREQRRAPSTSVILLDPLAPRANRRWQVTSDLIEGVLGPEGFRVTAPRAASGFGIAAGDVIVSVDGHPPRGVLAVFTSLQRDPDRATVTIEVDRRGSRLVQVYRVR